MKATTYEAVKRGQKSARCDKILGVTRVTPKPKRERQQLKTHKQYVKSGMRKINKTFVLTNPELFDLEIACCDTENVTPSEYLEAEIEVDGRFVISALIYGYSAITDEH